jgi:UDP-N-acetylglucosamine--N-acetylmuramyl-(pentapeptide) pyrophosphoryl-undecaprenol N-acetylglucosamine transferase
MEPFGSAPTTEPPVPHRGLERLAIAGGGSGGHVYPAVALAETIREVRPDLDLLFIGTAAGCEARIAPAEGLRFAAVPAAPFYRVGSLERIRTIPQVVRGVLAARRLLRSERIDLVLGLGGFASAGAVLSAWSLGLPTVLHEANATAGLANRRFAPLVDRVLLGFAEAERDFPRSHCVATGTPVRRALLTVGEKRSAWTAASGRPFRLLVLGGSGGSPFLNAQAPVLAAAVARAGIPVAVEHQTGTEDLAPIRAAYVRANVEAEAIPYLDDIGAAYGRADFALTCAGACTLAELAAVRLPALVVPLATAARNHEVANARAAAELAGVWWTTEETWSTSTLAVRIAALAADAVGAREMSERIGRARSEHAGVQVLAACEETFAARGRRKSSPHSEAAPPRSSAR